MRVLIRFFIAFFSICFFHDTAFTQEANYPWLKHLGQDYDTSQSIASRIEPPAGYTRIDVKDGSYQAWLRHLPLKPGRPPVLLFDGKRKGNQRAHYAVIDLDVGKKNLQQCADAVIRLRAEYFFSIKNFSAIHFNFTSGDRIDFNRWAKGERPIVRGNKVQWRSSGKTGKGYVNFRNYLTTIFTYAGTLSLSRELKTVRNINEMEIGDVFIQGGSPGHAVTVLDMAVRGNTGEKVFLLAQSYMPAQEMHVLVNPNDSALSPWYRNDFSEMLQTPEWTFRKSDIKRFVSE